MKAILKYYYIFGVQKARLIRWRHTFHKKDSGSIFGTIFFSLNTSRRDPQAQKWEHIPSLVGCDSKINPSPKMCFVVYYANIVQSSWWWKTLNLVIKHMSIQYLISRSFIVILKL